MERRRFLSLTVLSLPLTGCIDDTGGGTATESPAHTVTDTDTESPTPNGVTPECGPSLCAGTTLAEVIVVHDFSGEVTVEAACRDEEFAIPPGESIHIDRMEDAETCRISVSVDGNTVFTEEIEDYEQVTLTVNAAGDVDAGWTVT